MYEQIEQAAAYIQHIYNKVPRVGIILGTGLGGLIEEMEVAHVIPYREIPHFPVATVESHSGKLILGRLSDKEVVVMQGRFHYYEGYSMQQITFPVRVMKLLGIEALFISNASGGLNPDFRLGDLMVITDHINLQADNPLRGPNLDRFGVRFPDMSEAYDRNLISMAQQVAHDLDFLLREGVYVSVPGPNLETPAEYRMLRIMGADTVGMSTVPEVIVARHCDLPVFAVSVITDLGVPGHIVKVSLEDVIRVASKATPKMVTLFKEMTHRL